MEGSGDAAPWPAEHESPDGTYDDMPVVKYTPSDREPTNDTLEHSGGSGAGAQLAAPRPPAGPRPALQRQAGNGSERRPSVSSLNTSQRLAVDVHREHTDVSHHSGSDTDLNTSANLLAPIIPSASGYSPSDFAHLDVGQEIKELFQFVEGYEAQMIIIEPYLRTRVVMQFRVSVLASHTRVVGEDKPPRRICIILCPFLLDYIPAVGDIDAFIKIPRPDDVDDNLGLTVLDEPCARQSDPTVLDLHMRAHSKHAPAAGSGGGADVVVKRIDRADGRQIEQWIENIKELHRSRPPASVNYTRPMPDVDTLIAEWPPEVQDTLKNLTLPSADMNVSLQEYADMVCTILDIPVHPKSRIQSLHMLFTLFSRIKEEQRHLNDESVLSHKVSNVTDRLEL